MAELLFILFAIATQALLAVNGVSDPGTYLAAAGILSLAGLIGFALGLFTLPQPKPQPVPVKDRRRTSR